jgi:hypothetical protein
MASTASLLLLVAFFVPGHGEHALDDGALLLAGGHHRLRMTEAMYKVVAGMFFQDGGSSYCRQSFSAVLARKAQQGN